MRFSQIKRSIWNAWLNWSTIDSYDWFLEEGLREVFEDITLSQDYTGKP